MSTIVTRKQYTTEEFLKIVNLKLENKIGRETLYYYRNEGLIKPKVSGRRLIFCDDDLTRIEVIQTAQAVTGYMWKRWARAACTPKQSPYKILKAIELIREEKLVIEQIDEMEDKLCEVILDHLDRKVPFSRWEAEKVVLPEILKYKYTTEDVIREIPGPKYEIKLLIRTAGILQGIPPEKRGENGRFNEVDLVILKGCHLVIKSEEHKKLQGFTIQKNVKGDIVTPISKDFEMQLGAGMVVPRLRQLAWVASGLRIILLRGKMRKADVNHIVLNLLGRVLIHRIKKQLKSPRFRKRRRRVNFLVDERILNWLNMY